MDKLLSGHQQYFLYACNGMCCVVNTLMAHRDIKNLERRNILFISMHFMMTKRLQTIDLSALLLEEEERNEDTFLRTQKRSCWVRYLF